MNVEDQAKLGMAFNKNLSNKRWYKDGDGHQYLTDPSKLVNISGLNNTNSEGKMKASEEVSTFIKNTDQLIGDIISGKTPRNMNPNDLTMFQGLSTNDKLTLTSVLRSLQDNTKAYRNRLDEMTVSPHMAGNSVDISTSSGQQGKVGRALWDFFKTSSGKSFLKNNNMNALYHDAGTGYHIDVSKATGSRPAGGITDKSQ